MPRYYLPAINGLQILSVKEEDDEGIHVLGIVATTNTWVNSRKKRREEKRRLAQLQDGGEQNGNGTSSAECENPARDCAPESTETTVDSAKRKLEGIACENPSKKVKTEVEHVKDAYLKALITILELDDAVKLEILYMDGTGGRDSCNQLLVYLKGHLKDVE